MDMQSNTSSSENQVKMTSNQSVPSPRPLSTSTSVSVTTSTTSSRPARRLSLNIPNPSYGHGRSHPIPVPAPGPVPTRHGSISYSQSHSHRHQHRSSFGTSFGTSVERRVGSSLSLSLGRGGELGGYGVSKRMEDDEWLGIGISDIVSDDGGEVMVDGDEAMEKAVEVLLQSGRESLLVNINPDRGEYAFFDFSDLNVFLLLVLQAASLPSTDVETTSSDRRGHIIRLLRGSGKVPVSLVCNISGKNPCHQFKSTTTLRDLVPLLASGIHRVLFTPTDSAVRIVTASNVLEHLVASNPPEYFNQTFLSPSLDLPLHPLVSLTSGDSVLDSMQVMSLNNLSALGVIDQSVTSITHGQTQGHRRSSSSSGSSASYPGTRKETRSGSSSFYKSPSSSQVFSVSPQILPSPGAELPSPFDGSGSGSGNGELVNVITAEGCARLVVPSQGKEALGMGLAEAAKMLQQVEYAGQERGEERVPVHTITCHSSLLHASHLLLATSSSRIFLRTPGVGISPSLSPTIPSPPSPSFSISSLSLSDAVKPGPGTGLPVPPPTKFSPHYVVSITDIFASLVKAYQHSLAQDHPTISTPVSLGSKSTKEEAKGKQDVNVNVRVLDTCTSPARVSREGTEGMGGGLGSWKWAKGETEEAGGKQ